MLDAHEPESSDAGRMSTAPKVRHFAAPAVAEGNEIPHREEVVSDEASADLGSMPTKASASAPAEAAMVIELAFVLLAVFGIEEYKNRAAYCLLILLQMRIFS